MVRKIKKEQPTIAQMTRVKAEKLGEARLMNKIKSFSKFFICAILSAIIGIIVGIIGQHSNKIVERIWPNVTIECPKDNTVFTHEYKIYGKYTIGREVAIYIYTDDGTETQKYWRQILVHHNADIDAWSVLARFGNPFMIDHYNEEEPIYVLFVALYKQGIKFAIPGEEKGIYKTKQKLAISDFESVLMNAGATKVTHCKIKRKPEKIIRYAQKAPQIISPQQSICQWHVDRLLPGCDPTIIASVQSPVTFKWREKNESMYAELYRKGEPEIGFPRENMQYGETFHLSPGIYEFKIRHNERDEWFSSVWFTVESSQQY